MILALLRLNSDMPRETMLPCERNRNGYYDIVDNRGKFFLFISGNKTIQMAKEIRSREANFH